MTKFVALLRGINVGGASTLAMRDLVDICERVGLEHVRTYINTGNVLFESNLSVASLQKKLEGALLKERERKTEVVIRTMAELALVAQHNPFSDVPPAKVGVTFFNGALPKSYLKGFTHGGPEQIEVADREVYVYYPDGMGRSKLKLPPTPEAGTVRNVNTVTKLVGLLNNLVS